MFFSKTAVAAAALSLLQLTSAAPAAEPIAEGNTFNATQQLVARDSGTFKWFNPGVGIGACGWHKQDWELVVALNAQQFDPHTPNGNPNRNSLCGRRMRVRANGRSVDVTVSDRYPSPPSQWGDLDLSPAAFSQLAHTDVGAISGTWEWI